MLHKNNFAKQSTKQIPSDGNTFEALLNKAISAQKRSKALTHLIHAEKNKCCYAVFHNHTKPWLSGGLMYMTINNDPQQPPTTILDHDELGNTLLAYSWNHLPRHMDPHLPCLPLIVCFNMMDSIPSVIWSSRDTMSLIPFHLTSLHVLFSLISATKLALTAKATLSTMEQWWMAKINGQKNQLHLNLDTILESTTLQCHV